MKTFLTLAFLTVFGAFVAQPASAQGAGAGLVVNIQNALSADNPQEAARLASEAIAEDPALATQLINLIVASDPNAASDLAKQIAQNAPEQFSGALDTLQTALANANSTSIYNQIIADVATAAGGNANNNPFANLPAKVLTKIRNLNNSINGNGNGLQTIVEQAQQSSPN